MPVGNAGDAAGADGRIDESIGDTIGRKKALAISVILMQMGSLPLPANSTAPIIPATVFQA
jgi:hypothetical protein